jgi:glycine cleavage system aminomethyltransferase T
MLDDHGGIVSDVTVARLEEDRFVLGGNGPRDLAWLRTHAPADVTVSGVTDQRASAALWGPAARDILSAITDADLSNEAFPYLTCRRLSIADMDVDAVRISYAGELGWELTVAASDGAGLWNALWNAGRAHGLIAAGRAALGTLRLEKGYRAWGTDMTRQHGPEEAGLAFTVRRTDTAFLGAEALVARPKATRVLRCLVLEDEQVAMGAEPVLVDGEAIGFVTSAGWGASVGRSIALAWIPRSLVTGDVVAIAYFDRMLPARVADEPLFDPSGERLRA